MIIIDLCSKSSTCGQGRADGGTALCAKCRGGEHASPKRGTWLPYLSATMFGILTAFSQTRIVWWEQATDHISPHYHVGHSKTLQASIFGHPHRLLDRQVQQASNRTLHLEAEVKREADFNASLEEMIISCASEHDIPSVFQCHRMMSL